MKRQTFIDAAKTQVNKGIYVWGARGQDVTAMKDPTAWFLKCESGNTTNVKRIETLYNKRLKDGVKPIRAFDCSGFIYWCNEQAKIGLSRRNADGIYHKYCNPIVELQAADLVFHYSDDSDKITHVGMYVGDDTVIESEGRDVGVVETSFKKKEKYWNRFGRLKKLESEYKHGLLGDANCDDEVTAADASLILRYIAGISTMTEQGKANADFNQDGKITKEDAEAILKYLVKDDDEQQTIHMTGSLCLREAGNKDAKCIGYCHRGKDYPLLGTDPDTGWYKTESAGKIGYISNRTKYTEIR